MVGCCSFCAAAREETRHKTNNAKMEGHRARRWMMSFMASSIGDHSVGEMPSRLGSQCVKDAENGRGGYTPPSKYIELKRKELREGQFVSC